MKPSGAGHYSKMNSLIESANQIFYKVLDETVSALDESGVPYALMGGIAVAALGCQRFTHDIDVFVKPEDAEMALAALEAKGFRTEKTDLLWLFKGFKNDVLVDVIFKSAGTIHLDQEMLERSRVVEFYGRKIRALGPEDLFVIKALVLNEHCLNFDENCLRHLSDVLGLIRSCELDWEYILKRARLGPRRMLGLLIYAQSLDLLVPNRVIKALAEQLEIC
jgi:predicted nucleotidyltransferase